MRVAKWIAIGAFIYVVIAIITAVLALPNGISQLVSMVIAVGVGVIGYRTEKARATGIPLSARPSAAPAPDIEGIWMVRLKWIAIAVAIWFIGGLAIGLTMVAFDQSSSGTGFISGLAGLGISARGYRNDRNNRLTAQAVPVDQLSEPVDSARL